jgi:hypothetical protein
MNLVSLMAVHPLKIQEQHYIVKISSCDILFLSDTDILCLVIFQDFDRYFAY